MARKQRTGPWISAETTDKVKRGIAMVAERRNTSQATVVRTAVMAYLKRILKEWR